MRSGADSLLQISGLSVQGRGRALGGRPLVRDVSFDVRRGEVVGLIGESGAGKSTIGLAAMGYARPGCAITSGRVTMGSTDILSLGRDELLRWRGLRVGYVAQSAAAAFNPALRVGAQIVEAPVFHGLMSASEARRRSVELFRRVDLPDPDLIGSKFPHQVSGGQLQRLLAVMAVACGPDLLVLDEPTTALDVTTQVHLLKTLKGILREEGRSAIYVTHDLATLSQIADWIVVLRAGRIVEQGSTEQVISDPKESYTKQLIGAVGQSPKAIDVPRVGSPEAAPYLRPPLLSLAHVHAGYGRRRGHRWDRTVLTDIDLDLGPGEILGVIGESGSGKSTLARVISGLLPSAQGTIRLQGKPLPANVGDRSRELLRRVQLVTQMPDLAFNPTHRIGDILGRPLTFYFGMDTAARRARVVELLEMVGLPADYVGRLPSELSGGEKQRINLARALAAKPDVILCDEVTSALDTLVTIRVLDLLKSFRSDLGISIVFISHDISTVSELSDRIAVLYNGRIVQQGPTKDVVQSPCHPYRRLLLDSVPELLPGWIEELDEMDLPESLSSDKRAVGSAGCSFYPRCPLRIDGLCNNEDPPLRLSQRGATIACQRNIEELRGDACTRS